MTTFRIVISVALIVAFGLGATVYAQSETTKVTVTAQSPKQKVPRCIKERSLLKVKPTKMNIERDDFRINETADGSEPIVAGKVYSKYLCLPVMSVAEYEIPKWAKSFSAVGVSLKSKDVKFVIKCDGKIVYDGVSLTSCPDQVDKININLPANPESLELITEKLSDGADTYTLWYEPRIYSENIDDRKLYRIEKVKKERLSYSPASYGVEFKSDGCLMLGLPDRIFVGNNITYDFWVWPATFDQVGMMLFDGDDQPGLDRELAFVNGKIMLRSTSSFPSTLISKDKLLEDSWNYVAFTISDTNVSVYLNGEKTAQYDGEVKPMVNASTIYAGRYLYQYRYAGDQFRGLITDIRIWNRSLSAKEIENSYYRKPISPDKLIGRWNFEKGEVNSGSCEYQNSAVMGEAKIIRLKVKPKCKSKKKKRRSR